MYDKNVRKSNLIKKLKPVVIAVISYIVGDCISVQFFNGSFWTTLLVMFLIMCIIMPFDIIIDKKIDKSID